VAMFPDGVPQRYHHQISHELQLIEQLGYAPYFLTVNSIVAESRRRGIRSCPSTWCNFGCATEPHRSGGLGCNL